MARVRLVVHKTWLVHNPPADLDAAIDEAIAPFGMTAVRVGDRIELTGGSSFKVKALGVKFTADADLPRVGAIEHSAAAGDDAPERVTVHLEERLNSAILDPAAKQKYERVFGAIAASVEAALSRQPSDPADPEAADRGGLHTGSRASDPIVSPVGWWTDVALGTIVKRCHVAGAKRQDWGGLVATEAGIAFTGNPKGGCRWEDLANIEVIELRDNRGMRRQVQRFVLLTHASGETGEFWISGPDPAAVYAIHALLHAAD